MGVDTISHEPKNRIVRLANGDRIGVIGDHVSFEAGIPLFSRDPRQTAAFNTGVLCRYRCYGRSTLIFAIQQVLLAVISGCNTVPK